MDRDRPHRTPLPDPAARPVDAALRLIVGQMPAVVWALDRELRFTESQGGGLARLGLSPGEVLGMHLFEYLGTDDRSSLPIAAHLSALEGHGSSYEVDVGGRVYLSRVEPLVDRDEIVGVVGMAFDITERRGAERELETMYTALRLTEASRRDLLIELMRAHELEASRVASDLHDGAAQTFAAVAYRLQALRNASGDEDTRTALDKLVRMTNDGIAQLRSLMVDLVPPEVETEGLERAVAELIRRFEQETGTDAKLEIRIDVPPSAEIAKTCYRNVQEALRNVREHARANRVNVSLVSDERAITVMVQDDGTGFEVAARGPNGHLGLRGMRERIESLDGHIEIDSDLGRGTTVAFSLPLRATLRRPPVTLDA
jgi:PAS domain S-box-containing protein